MYWLWILRKRVKEIAALMTQLNAVASISDSLPIMARAAHRAKLPLINVDNIQKIRLCSFRDLPFWLKIYWHSIDMLSRWHFLRPEYFVLSNFHYKTNPSKHARVKMMNVFLQSEFADYEPQLSPMSGLNVLDAREYPTLDTQNCKS